MRRTSTGAGVGRLGRLAAMAWVVVLVAVGSAGVAAAGANRWTTNGPDGGGVFALAVDPGTPTTVYVGTDDSGVFKSIDAGGSWSAANTGLTFLGVRALALDPATPTTVYAGTDGGSVFGIRQIPIATAAGASLALGGRRCGRATSCGSTWSGRTPARRGSSTSSSGFSCRRA